jgi:hypothetical protein
MSVCLVLIRQVEISFTYTNTPSQIRLKTNFHGNRGWVLNLLPEMIHSLKLKRMNNMPATMKRAIDVAESQANPMPPSKMTVTNRIDAPNDRIAPLKSKLRKDLKR